MTQYRIISSNDGSSVEMFTCNKGWIGVVHFTNPNHRIHAEQWVKHERYLDRLDNA